MIEGRLVRLRARDPADAERAHAWITDWEVARFLVARYPLSLAHERAWLDVSPMPSFNHVPLAIDTLDGVHIGNIDLRAIQPENRTAEIGVMIGDKAYWSRGYGSDAVRTLARFAFRQMNLERVYLHTYEFNERGQRAFLKAGFTVEGRMRRHVYVDGRSWDVIIMGLLRDEFEEQEAANRS